MPAACIALIIVFLSDPPPHTLPRRRCPPLFSLHSDQPLLAINPISLDIDAPGTVADAGSTARYPLALATDLNHTSVVHALMFASINNSKTYNADYEESYRAALLTACTNGNSDLTLLIVRVMPSLINIQANKIGLTPLILAIQGGHIATMDVLISAGCDCNLGRTDNGVTPLLTAAVFLAECCTEANPTHGLVMIEMLLRAGANTEQRTFGNLKEKLTPLLYLATTSGLTGCQLLGAYGANLDSKDDQNQSLEHYASGGAPSKRTTKAQSGKMLAWIKKCKSFNKLQIAVHSGRASTVQWLLCKSNGGRGIDPRHIPENTPSLLNIAQNLNDKSTLMRKAVKAALRFWTPTNHWYYPALGHTNLHWLLLCKTRVASTSALPFLPNELWFYIGSFVVVR